MYRGFKLRGIDGATFGKITGCRINDDVTRRGWEQTEASVRSIQTAVDRLSAKDDVIDGDLLEASWFPQGDFDVFISHSHADRDLALALSGTLQRCFGLKAFVDSCVWNCRDRLIEKIRELSGNDPMRPCMNSDDENAVISHADMMLNCSLLRMIDSCECLMFIDTPRSIRRQDLVDKTFSAWLYSEITISKFIRRVTPERRWCRRRRLNESLSPAMDSLALNVSHGADLDHLSGLTPDTFVCWARQVDVKGLSGRESFDPLYDLMPE